jgi:hypothetical protein
MTDDLDAGPPPVVLYALYAFLVIVLIAVFAIVGAFI